MKKILTILLCVLMLASCSSQNTSTTNAPSEGNDSLNQEEDATTQNNEEDKTLTQDVVVKADLRNKETLIDFIFENVEVDEGYTKERAISELVFLYDDFTEDGEEDVVCYSKNLDGMKDVVFVTINNSEYQRINGFDGSTQYDQEVSKQGEFITYISSGGGTGVYHKMMDIYRYKAGKIQSTGVSLELEGHSTASNGDAIIISGSISNVGNDKLVSFIYNYEESNKSEDELILSTSHKYNYDEIKNTYVITPEPYGSSIEENETTAQDNTTKSLKTSYKLEDMKVGEKFQGFTISEVEGDSKKGKFVLKGEKTFKGKIYFDENIDYYVIIKTCMFDVPVIINDNEINGPEFVWVDKKWINDLPEGAKNYFNENGTLEVNVTINEYVCDRLYEFQSADSVVIKSLEPLQSLKPEGSYYYFTDLNDVDKIGGFTVMSVIKVDGSNSRLDLRAHGDATLKGVLAYDETDGIYTFTANNPVFDKPIKIGDAEVYGPYKAQIENIDPFRFPDDVRTELYEELAIPVELTIIGYTIENDSQNSLNETISVSLHTIKSLTEKTTSKDSGSYARETLYSNGSQVTVDYDENYLVIIPDQNSIHQDKLTEKTIEFTKSGYEKPYYLTVIGELDTLVVTYYENPMDDSIEPIVEEVNGIKNQFITILSKLPTDTSNIRVQGWTSHNGETYSFDFRFDGMTPSQDYEILMYKK